MRKYPSVMEGEWVAPVRRGYKMACCDCGLVHKMEFKLVKAARGKLILMRAFRDNRATATIRREMKKRDEGTLCGSPP